MTNIFSGFVFRMVRQAKPDLPGPVRPANMTHDCDRQTHVHSHLLTHYDETQDPLRFKLA